MSDWTHQNSRSRSLLGVTWPSSTADALLRLTDGALAGVIFVAPLVLGGRHDFGRFVFVAFTAIASVSYFARQAVAGQGHWVRGPANALALAVATLLVLQLIPLPPSWIEILSPRTFALLPLWTGGGDPGELGRWSTLSLTPEATRLSLAMALAYALLFITVSHRIADHADVQRLLRWIGLSACVMAAIGLLQAAVPNGRFLWVYQHPSDTTFDRLSGPFANRNHFAHFLVLGMGSLLASALMTRHGSRRDRSPMRGRSATPIAMVAAIAVAVVLTGSRGGVIALVAASGAFGILLYRAGHVSGRTLGVAASAAVLLLLSVTLFGYEQVTSRLGSLATAKVADIDENAGRRKIWAANVEAIKSGGLFGAGAGSHRDIYPVYLDDPPIKEYTHADNGYLQIVTENGAAGAALLAAGLLLCGYWAWRALAPSTSPRTALLAIACASSLVASVVHSLFDFVWYLPSCLSLTLILTACLMRLGQLKDQPVPSASFRFRRAGSINVAFATAFIALAATHQWFGPAMASLHWDAYHRASKAQQEIETDWLSLAPEVAAAARAESRPANVAALETMIDELEQAVAWRPSFAAAHRQLANRYSDLYHLLAEQSDNPMPAPQLREAAIASGFKSAAELDAWLEAAIGPNRRLLHQSLRHALAAARLSPLQGSPYLRLAALSFFRGAGHAAADAYLQQTLFVRPYDGDLLFEVGAELCARGAVEQGVDCWAQAFRLDGNHRLKVARAVAGNLTFGDLAERFHPQWDTLGEFWKVYRNGDEHNVAAFLSYARAQTERETGVAKTGGNLERVAALWRRFAEVQVDADQLDAAVISLLHSRDAWPDDYVTRRMLGLVLLQAGRSEQAASELQWCLDRRSEDAQVAQALRKISRERLAADPNRTINHQ